MQIQHWGVDIPTRGLSSSTKQTYIVSIDSQWTAEASSRLTTSSKMVLKSHTIVSIFF